MEAPTVDQIRTALSYIPNDDRDLWVRMAMAIRSELSESGFDMWDEWSQTDPTYRPSDAKTTWKSANSKSITIATLFYEAGKYGYKPEKTHTPTSEEIAERKKQREESLARAAQQEQERHKKAAEKSIEIWNSAFPVQPTDTHPYATRKNIILPSNIRIGTYHRWHDGTTYQIENCLLIPLRDKDKNLTSLQAIFPETHSVIGRDRDYLPGGKKQGSYYAIVGIMDTIAICEGFSTGVTIFQATGYTTVVAFDRSNLSEIAKIVRKKYPDAKIIIAADNDKYGKSNPGVHDASLAAACSGASIIIPKFSDESSQPTDFNDMAAIDGLQSVSDLFNPPPTSAQAPIDEPVTHEFFRILGYASDKFFVYQYEKKQIIEMTKGDLSTNGFLEMAPEEYWDLSFPGKTGFNKTNAASWFIRECYRAGVYDPTKTRGKGAWIDAGRTVFHFGSHLWVDGQIMSVNQIQSKYVYQLDHGISCQSSQPLTDTEGQRLLDVSKMFRWNKPSSAALLLGWVALAPFSGALKWRPHIWLTGGAGCGKSTILNDYVHVLLAGTNIFAQGNSTEAGLRQTLKTDAVPVLFDESEQNNEREESRVQNVISLIRQSSTESGAVTYKGTATGESMQFIIRSMFCLSSIGVGIKHQADFERLTILSLRPKFDDDDASSTWNQLKSELAALSIDEKMPPRLFFRTLSMLPTVAQNIKVFVTAASKKFNSVREGDQYGTLMAGCWSVINTKPATTEDAEKLINAFDWDEYRENTETDESSRALMTLMEAKIRITGGDISVYECITAARTGKSPEGGFKLDKMDAEAVLERHGMRISDKEILLSNTSKSLSDLFKNTPYHSDWRSQILRITGSKRHNKAERINGVPTKCVSLPLSIIEVSTESPPF